MACQAGADQYQRQAVHNEEGPPPCDADAIGLAQMDITSKSEKIAFLILAHTDPKHLYRLCRALGSKDDIFVHVDKRTDLSSFDKMSTPSNVRFTHLRIPVFWGDISVVEATLILLEEALRSKTPYLRLVLLSGSCYPVKAVEQLHKYFFKKEHIDMVYINMLEHPELTWRVSRYWFKKPWIPYLREARCANRYLVFCDRLVRKLTSNALRPKDRGFRRKFPELVPYFGSQFWSITVECASMILGFVRDHPEFLYYHKYSWAPDEHFFHTIVGNSELSGSSGGAVPYGTNILNLHIHRPPVLTLDHLEEILVCDKFFARKAATGESDLLLDYLDEHVLSI